jgi:adenosylmethionine-8-amino-7-oxononanoate aminotransferase
MREEGSVITRIVGDNVLFAPPLCVNADEIDQMLDAVKAAVDSVTLT